MNDPIESKPQLPHTVFGVAYEDAMGGISVDLCLDASGKTDPNELLSRHTDAELVYVIPTNSQAMNIVKHADELLAALIRIVNDTPVPGEDAVLTVAGYNQACEAIAKVRGEVAVKVRKVVKVKKTKISGESFLKAVLDKRERENRFIQAEIDEQNAGN